MWYNKMPEYADQNGNKHTIADYAGASFRVPVANRALRTGNFTWLQLPDGSWFPMFICCMCKHPCFYNGIEGDHLIQQSRGGTDELFNLQLLCTSRNHGHNARNDAPAFNTRAAHKAQRDGQRGYYPVHPRDHSRARSTPAGRKLSGRRANRSPAIRLASAPPTTIASAEYGSK